MPVPRNFTDMSRWKENCSKRQFIDLFMNLDGPLQYPCVDYQIENIIVFEEFW